MVVPLKTAQKWEGHGPELQDPAPYVPPLAVSAMIYDHFVTARTQDWETRLANYWASQRQAEVDEEKFGNYRWIQFSKVYCRNPDLNMHPVQEHGESFSGMLSRLLNSDPDSLHDAGAESVAYKLRSTVAMRRRLRIGTEFQGFLQLPSEIRNIVYGFLLPKGTYIVLNDPFFRNDFWRGFGGNTYERYHGLEESLRALQSRHKRETLGLLQGVSRVIHAEATGVFFGGNRFIFPFGECSRPSFFNTLVGIASNDVQVMERRFCSRSERGVNNAPLVRDVSYTFDMRDHVERDYINLYFNDTLRADINQARISSQDALRRLHDQKTYELEVAWAERIDCIKWMTLDRLQLSFEECYCSIGCCRKVEWVLDRFLHTGPLPGTADDDENVYSMLDWKARPPLVIECAGWKSDREAELIWEKLGKLGGSMGPVKVRLGLDIATEEPELDADDRFVLECLTRSETSSG